MSKRAVIYTRVSTDEQAEKGYSLRDQQEKLQRYCQQNQIDVARHFQEDYSAKDFNRPEWKLLMQFLQKNKRDIDLFMFAKWDRFSRNMNESLNVLNKIKSLGIEIYCLENNIDDSIPENKVMQMLMLLMPQVENERRSLNVIAGMRRAMKEGKWPRQAPVGYKNTRDEFNNPTIIADPEKALFIREAFIEMAKGEKTQQEIRAELCKSGFKCSKNNFSLLLRNKFYIGKILIPAYKDEIEAIVEGLHEPIVDDHIFYKVQDVLSGRNKKKTSSGIITDRPEIPLRGYILCVNCGGKLTGSASRGNGGRYFYYHCNRCGKRFRAEVVNDAFERLLNKMVLSDEVKELFLLAVKEISQQSIVSNKKGLEHLTKELNKQTARKQRLEDSFLDGEISGADYSKLSKRTDDAIIKLKLRKEDIESSNGDFNSNLLKGVNTILNLNDLYTKANLESKKQIIGSIFPRKFIFDQTEVRTDQMNEVVHWVLKNSKAFEQKKKGQPSVKSQSSSLVIPPGFEPRS